MEMLLFDVWALLALKPCPGKAVWKSIISQYVERHRRVEEGDGKS
jgi:hypothetical protein